MNAQQGYIDSWAAMSEKMASALQPPPRRPRNPWVEAMQQWETMVPGHESRPYMQRMLDQGKAFFEMSNEINDFLRLLNDVNQSTEEWQSAFRAQMEQMKDAFGTGQGEMSALWSQPIDAFKQAWGQPGFNQETFLKGFSPDMFSGFNPSMFTSGFNPSAFGSAPFMQGFDPNQMLEMFSAPMQEQFEKFIDAPGVGPDREAQERFKKDARLWMNYQTALAEYNTAHQQVGKDTIERLTEKMIELSNEGTTIESMRAVYDVWVDCAEEAYAEFAMSEEYQNVYANLVNSMMAVKQAFRDRVNETAKSMGLPTQSGFDTVLERMQVMRRELRQIKKQGSGGSSNADVSKLKAEVNELKSELKSLKAAIEKLSEAKPAPAVRKKRATKKTTAKSTSEK